MSIVIRAYIATGLAIAAYLTPQESWSGDEPVVSKPTVSKGVVPSASDLTAKDVSTMPRWKPGDPVRVRQDLKVSADPNGSWSAGEPVISKPTVSKAVVPSASGLTAKDVSTIPRWKPGDPVRVKQDLRVSADPNEGHESGPQPKDSKKPAARP